jgi:hypothetical protein
MNEMKTSKNAPAPIGAIIENVTINNVAAPTSEHQSRALEALARAAEANAVAIGRIADALRGAEAHMEHGIHLSDIRGA